MCSQGVWKKKIYFPLLSKEEPLKDKSPSFVPASSSKVHTVYSQPFQFCKSLTARNLTCKSAAYARY